MPLSAAVKSVASTDIVDQLHALILQSLEDDQAAAEDRSQRAFQAAKSANDSKNRRGSHGPDYIEQCEFRLLAVYLRGLQNDIYFQIGLVTLVGLGSKNAILIVEFAQLKVQEGMSVFDAAVEGARLRFRPIVMTSLAFILGVLPLVLASGAGAEMRQSLGTAVFSGMLGVTVFGLLFTPVFYIVCRGFSQRTERRRRRMPDAGKMEWPT